MAIKPRTIKGKEIPAGMEHLVPVRHTDEGAEDYNRGKVQSRVEVTSDPFEKLLAKHAESPAAQPWEYTDPVHAIVSEHGKPGMAHRLLSESVVKQRGLRGYKPVVDAKGDLVRLGTSVLAEMPVEMKAKRDQRFRDESRDAVRNAQEDLIEKQVQTVRDSNAMGIGPLESNQMMQDARNPQSTMQTGLQVRRGNSI